MPRHLNVKSLQRICLLNIAANMDNFWCKDYDNQFGNEEFVTCNIGPFEFVMNANIQQLLTILIEQQKVRRVHLELLLTSNLTVLHLHFPRNVKLTLNAVSRMIGVRCNRLTELTLLHDGAKVTPHHLVQLVRCLPNLTYLDLSENSTNDQVVTAISQTCSNLRTLKLRCCPLTDSSIFALCQNFGSPKAPCAELCTLDIHGTAVTSRAIAMAIDKLKKLRHIVHDDLVRPLALLHADDSLTPNAKHQLQSLSGYFMTDLPLRENPINVFRKIVVHCPYITTISFVNLMDDESLLCFADYQLRSVTLNAFCDKSGITFAGGILPLISRCGHRLQHLYLSEINRIDFGAIGSFCPILKTLKVHYYDIREFTVLYTPDDKKVFTNLEKLELAQSDANQSSSFSPALGSVLSSAAALRHLNLTCVQSFDDAVIEHTLLLNRLPQLETLVLFQCHHVSYPAILEVILSCDELHTVKLYECRDIYRRDYDSLVQFLHENYYDIEVAWT